MGPQRTLRLSKGPLYRPSILITQCHVFHHIPNPLTHLMSSHRHFFKSFETLLQPNLHKLVHRLRIQYLSTLSRFPFLLPLRESSYTLFAFFSFLFFLTSLFLNQNPPSVSNSHPHAVTASAPYLIIDSFILETTSLLFNNHFRKKEKKNLAATGSPPGCVPSSPAPHYIHLLLTPFTIYSSSPISLLLFDFKSLLQSPHSPLLFRLLFPKFFHQTVISPFPHHLPNHPPRSLHSRRLIPKQQKQENRFLLQLNRLTVVVKTFDAKLFRLLISLIPLLRPILILIQSLSNLHRQSIKIAAQIVHCLIIPCLRCVRQCIPKRIHTHCRPPIYRLHQILLHSSTIVKH